MKETMKVIDRKLQSLREEAKRLGEKGPTAAIFAKEMKLDPSLFSRWRTDASIGVSRETLTAMQLGFSEDLAEQAELLAAVLRDRRCGPAADLVEILVRSSSKDTQKSGNRAGGLRENEYSPLLNAARSTKLDIRTMNAITIILDALVRKPHLRQILLAIAKGEKATPIQYSP